MCSQCEIPNLLILVQFRASYRMKLLFVGLYRGQPKQRLKTIHLRPGIKIGSVVEIGSSRRKGKIWERSLLKRLLGYASPSGWLFWFKLFTITHLATSTGLKSPNSGLSYGSCGISLMNLFRVERYTQAWAYADVDMLTDIPFSQLAIVRIDLQDRDRCAQPVEHPIELTSSFFEQTPIGPSDSRIHFFPCHGYS